MTERSSRLGAVTTAIGLTYGSYFAGNIVLVVVAAVFAAAGFGLAARPALRLFVSSVFLQGVAFGGIAIAYVALTERKFDFIPFDVPDRREAIVIIGGFFALLALLAAASAVISWLGLESAQNQIVEIGNRNPAVFLILIPLSFLLVGPGEELLYRGVVQGRLGEALHPARAVVLASALFASIHLFSLSGEGKVVYIAVAFVLALVLGAIYEYTGNLTVPAIVHGGYNAAQFAVAYLAATGAP